MVTATTRSPSWPTVTVLSAIGVLSAIHATVLLPLIAQLPERFDVSPADATWLVTITLIGGALATPIVSRLADMYGRRRMLLVTMFLMLVGTALLVFSDGFQFALLGRGLQGAGSSLLPVAMSIIKDVVPRERLGQGLALMGGTLGIGSATALPLAGLVYSQWGWDALFGGITVITAILILIAWRVLPRDIGRATYRFDFLGAALLTLGLVPLLLVIAQGTSWGWASPTILQLGSLSMLSFVSLFVWQFRAKYPLIDLRLARRRSVSISNVTAFTVAFSMMANSVLTSLQLGMPIAVGGFAMSASSIGLIMMVPSIISIALTPVLGWVLRRFGGRWSLIAGTLTLSGSYILRTQFDETLVGVLAGTIVAGIGFGLAFSALPMIVMASVPMAVAASANGVNSLFRMVGTTVSTAVITGLTAATSVAIDGRDYTTSETLHIAFWLCAVVSFAGGLLALLVPRGLEDTEDAIQTTDQRSEEDKK